jgi:hypothetical protein
MVGSLRLDPERRLDDDVARLRSFGATVDPFACRWNELVDADDLRLQSSAKVATRSSLMKAGERRVVDLNSAS